MGVRVETNLRKALNCAMRPTCSAYNTNDRISTTSPRVRNTSNCNGLDKELLDSLDKRITILHPGPVNRGVEITSEVADSDQSIILQQVENGVAVRMAVLYLLAAKRH